MAEYEVLKETINPCGGSKHSIREFLEIETDDPEAYIRENGRFPIRDVSHTPDGDLLIITGDVAGNIIRYTFSE